MSIKLVGALLTLCICTFFGIYIAVSYRKETVFLKDLIRTMDYMSSELQFHLTPLPLLLRHAAAQCCNSGLSLLFITLSNKLEDKYSCDMLRCFEDAIVSTGKTIPERCASALKELAGSMGRFDIDGQIRAIITVRNSCYDDYCAMTKDMAARLRNYRTLGICIGFAIIVLFV